MRSLLQTPKQNKKHSGSHDRDNPTGRVQRRGVGEDKEYVAHKMASTATYPSTYKNTVKEGGLSPPYSPPSLPPIPTPCLFPFSLMCMHILWMHACMQKLSEVEKELKRKFGVHSIFLMRLNCMWACDQISLRKKMAHKKKLWVYRKCRF